MRKNLLTIALMLAIFGSGSIGAAAQYTITVPKITDIFKPKTKKPKTEQPKQEQSRQEQSEQNQSGQEDFSSQQVFSNPNAPADYDANIKNGDLAVAALSDEGLRAVRVVAKSQGIYKTVSEDSYQTTYYFKANSVYPYFDLEAFEQIIGSNLYRASRYLECYAKKHKLDFNKLKGNSYSGPFGLNADAMRKELQELEPTFSEIEARLKNFSPRPDTFMPSNQNPALWYEITSQRAEYMQCAIGEQQVRDLENNPALLIAQIEAEELLKSIDQYDPATNNGMATDKKVALYAVSPAARNAWLKEYKALALEDRINKILKPVADGLAKKLPTHFHKLNGYAVRNAAEEALMKRAWGSPASYKIFKIGLAQTSWDIDKGVLGIPEARYKNGVIYSRDTSADHPYCYAAYINVVQDYAGGGRYGASRANLLNYYLVGCPAGK